jgi:hypothetical protein
MGKVVEVKTFKEDFYTWITCPFGGEYTCQRSVGVIPCDRDGK